MPAEAEGRSDHSIDSSVEIGIGADEDRVLATHLEDGALDPDLTGLRVRGALINLQADGFGAGKGDEAGLRVLDDGVAEGSARTGAEVDHAVGKAGLLEDFDKSGGDGG